MGLSEQAQGKDHGRGQGGPQDDEAVAQKPGKGLWG